MENVDYLISVLEKAALAQPNDFVSSTEYMEWQNAIEQVGDSKDQKFLTSLFSILANEYSETLIGLSLVALGKIGAKEIIPRIILLAEDDPSEIIRDSAIIAIGELQVQDATYLLGEIIASFSEDDEIARLCAIEALGKIGSSQAVEILGNSLQEESNIELRLATIAALAAIGDEAAISLLINIATQDSTSEVQLAAQRVIKQLRQF